MKSRMCGKILYFLLRLKLLEMIFPNYFPRQELVKKLLMKLMLKKFVGTVKIVRSVRDSIRSEFKKKGFSTFNKGIKYWDVRDHEQFEIKPIRDRRFRR